MKRRIVSVLTALALMLSFCPTWAFAAEADPSLCKHHREHTAECGYAAPTEGHPCGHQHTADCYTPGVLPDGDSGDPYEVGGDTENLLNCQHSHNSACGYVQDGPGTPCGYECKLCPIEALIAALPDTVTEDNRADVRAQLDEILALYGELNEDEQEEINLSRVYALQGALDAANVPSPVDGEVSVDYQAATWEGNEVTYATQTAGSCTPVTSSTTKWNTGWYVVNQNQNVETTTRITVSGEVHLILANGCKLDAKMGITVPKDSSLTIYGQTGGTGALIANADENHAGIGGSWRGSCGTITINGGTVEATGGGGTNGGAGIGSAYLQDTFGSTITINGGTVTATGGGTYGGAGIGGTRGSSNNTVTINGGTVTATGGGTSAGGAGIGGGSGSNPNSTVTINGGEVIATGGPSSDGIGNGEGGSNVAVTITGGTVTAKKGGNSGKDITDDKTITGGTVNGTTYCTVTFLNNREGVAEVPPQTLVSGEKATEPDPRVLEEYIRTWYTDQELTNQFNFDTPITGRLTLYAKWTHTMDHIVSVSRTLSNGNARTTKFTSLSAAWDALRPTSGTRSGTLTLLQNVTTSQTLEVSSGMNVTVKMNAGVTLTNNSADCFQVNGGTLTLASGTVVEGGSGKSVVYASSGTLNVEGGTYRSENGNCLYVEEAVTVQLSGGTLHASGIALHYGNRAVKEMLKAEHAISDGDGRLLLSRLNGTELAGNSNSYTVAACGTHGLQYTDQNDGTHLYMCTYCGYFNGQAEAHNYGDDGVCTACGAKAQAKVESSGTTRYYETLRGAWSGLSGTCTITLLKDANCSATKDDILAVSSGMDVTVEMADGVTLTAGQENCFSVTDGTLTLTESCKVEKGGSGNSFVDISSGKLYIKGGTYVNHAARGNGVWAKDAADVQISGGTFTVANDKLLLRHTTKPVSGMLVKGYGIFDGSDSLVTGVTGTELKSNGGTYTVKPCTHNFGADGICTVCGKPQAVAAVTLNGVTSTVDALADAFTAENKGATVTLLSDVKLSQPITISGGQFTLSGNGHTITYTGDGAAAIQIASGTVTLSGCKIDGKQWGVQVSDGTVKLSGCTITAAGDENGGGQGVYISGGDVTISGGTYSGKGGYAACGVEIQSGKLTIESGTFSGADGDRACGVNVGQNGKATIRDGSFSGTGGYDASGLRVTFGGNAVISGGVFTGSYYGVYNTGTTTISGGTFTGDTNPLYSNASLAGMLATGCAYYRDDKPIEVDNGLSPGTVMVRECDHTGVEVKDLGNGKHGLDCPYCGYHSEHTTTLTATASGNTVTLNGGCGTEGCNYAAELGTVSFTFENLVYGNPDAKVTFTNIPANYTLICQSHQRDDGMTEVSWTLAELFDSTKVTAGEHKMQVSFVNEAYSYSNACELTFSVAKAELTPSLTGTTTKTYDGTTAAPEGLKITLAGLVEGDSVTASASFAYNSENVNEANAITATNITLGGADAGNYTLSSTTATTTGTITKATVSITWGNTTQTATYSGTQATITVPTVSAENGVTVNVTPEYSYAAQGGATFTPGLPTSAGTYTVRASTVESGNLTAAQADMTLTINKATLTIDSAAVASKPYDKTTTATVEAVTFDGLKNGETLTLDTDYTATGTFADANAGEDKSVTVTVTLADTAKANNYTLASTSVNTTGTITKADPVVTAVSVSTPATIYESASLDSIALTHGVGDTAGTVALNPSQTLTVGTKGYAWTFTPDDTNNYNTATGTISLIVAVDALQSIAVTTPPSKTAYTYGENFDKAGMVITATYASGATKVVTGEVQISPAELTVTTTALTITYQGKTVTQAITVSPKTVSAPTIELSPSSFVYDGTGKEPAVTVKDGEKMIPADEYTVGYSNNINAGTAIVTITNVAGNYTVSGTTTFPITAKPLTGAKVEVSGTFTYTGNALTPAPTVTLDGKTLTANTDYTVAYDKNTDAGAAKITVTGKGNYSGTAQGTFTIGRATLTVEGTGTASGTYGDKLSELAVSGLTAKLGATEISGTWKLTGGTVPNVGDSGEYTATFTPATGAGNYNALTAKVTLNIAKANYTGTTTASTSAKFGATGTYDLSALLPDGATVETAATTSNIFEGTPSVSDKTLSYTLKADAAVGSTGTITMPVTSTNYNDFDLTITVTVTAKDVPTLTVSPITVTYTGEAVPGTAIKGTAKVGSTTVPGTWAFASGEAVTNVADSGTKTVKFVPSDKDTYAEATGTVVVTINKATPTGVPKYTAISASGKTLVDAGLTTEGGTFSTGGTVAWTLDNTTEVTANTQYEWTFTPTDTANYNTLTGKITLWPYTTPVNPGGGGGYVPSGPGGTTITVPVSGDKSTVHVSASVSGTTATVSKIDTTQIENVIGDNGQASMVEIDFTGLGKTIDTVKLPAAAIKDIAAKAQNEEVRGLTVKLPEAEISFDAKALSAIQAQAGSQITLTVTPAKPADLNSRQKEAVGSAPVFDLTLRSSSGAITDFRGGYATVSLPYTLTAGQNPSGVVVYYLDSAGNITPCTTMYDVGRKSAIFTTGHLSLYFVGYDPTAVWVNPFSDVAEGAWYYDAVRYASENGLMGGYGNGKFGPNDNLTRAQFAQILFNKEGRPVVNYLLRYNDVADGAWYTEAVRWAASLGIAGGYGNGMFGPNDNITREQLAVMLWRYAGSPAATDKELHFTDTGKASGFALEALRWAVESGVMGGYGDGRLDPKGLATRAQVAQMLKNYLEK